MLKHLALWVGVATALTATAAFAAPPKVGAPAPDFHAVTFDGKTVSLADYKGQVLVLNFWATWCGPCRQELPLLDTYYKVYQKYGLRVLAITTEGSVSDYQLKPLAKVLTIPLLHQLRGPYRDLGAIPTNFIIDRAGVVRYARASAFTLDELNKVLVPLLQEPAPVDAPAPVLTSPAM